MKQLRILLAVRPRLLSSTWRLLLEDHADVVVMDEVRSANDIVRCARRHKVDVVVTTLESRQDVPRLVTELLAQFPRMLVVGMNIPQDQVRTYLFEAKTIAPAGIIEAIKQRANTSSGAAEH